MSATNSYTAKEMGMESTYELPYDDKSHTMLERAIAALGGSREARVVVGKVYALGRIDGHTESAIERTALLQTALDKVAA